MPNAKVSHRFPVNGEASHQQAVLAAVARLGNWVQPTIEDGALVCTYGQAVNVEIARSRIESLIEQVLDRHVSAAALRRRSGGHGKASRHGRPRRRTS